MTFSDMMQTMQAEDDARMAWFAAHPSPDGWPAQPGLSINAPRAEQLLEAAGCTYRSGRVSTGATFREWTADDEQVYVLLNESRLPCWFRKGAAGPSKYDTSEPVYDAEPAPIARIG